MINLDMRRYLLLLTFFISYSLSAQTTITCKVASLADKKPIADASVFLSNTRAGTKTESDGIYNMYSVKDGQYELVVSCIGFEPYHLSVSVKGKDIALPNIELMPRMSIMREVNIRAKKGKKGDKRDYKRERYIRIFTEQFLGRTKNADNCKLLNPDLLDFEYDDNTDKLKATSSDFLIVENKSLGYRIKYLLRTFVYNPRVAVAAYTGWSVFEPLAGNAVQQLSWANKRADAYKGSEMRFLRSCIADAMIFNEFFVRKLYRKPNPLRFPDSVIYDKIKYLSSHPTEFGIKDSTKYWSAQYKIPAYQETASKDPIKLKEFVKLTDGKGIYAIDNVKPLMINFRRKESNSNYRTSYFIFKEPYTYFDNNGVIFTPDNLIIEGYWATLRLADLLPVDYELPNI